MFKNQRVEWAKLLQQLCDLKRKEPSKGTGQGPSND